MHQLYGQYALGMTRTFGSERARSILPELLEAAHRGRASVITKHGRPYAALVPINRMQRHSAPILALKGSGAGLWGPDSAAEIARQRNEWA